MSPRRLVRVVAIGAGTGGAFDGSVPAGALRPPAGDIPEPPALGGGRVYLLRAGG